MTDYLGKTATTPTVKTDPTTTGNPGGALDKDAFLKLLVAQLKYQDPSKPADSSQFIAQTAQFTTLEKLSAMAIGQQDLLAAQLQLGASNLIGRTVSYVDADAKTISGIVTSASFSGSTPTLKVGDKDVLLSSVKEVRNTPATV